MSSTAHRTPEDEERARGLVAALRDLTVEQMAVYCTISCNRVWADAEINKTLLLKAVPGLIGEWWAA